MEWVKFGRDLEGEIKCEDERADGRNTIRRNTKSIESSRHIPTVINGPI